jgi:hypothetical protein
LCRIIEKLHKIQLEKAIYRRCKLLISQEKILRKMTQKYIWWKSPEVALQHPKLIISKVMDIGDYHDVQKLAGFYSDPSFIMHRIKKYN